MLPPIRRRLLAVPVLLSPSTASVGVTTAILATTLITVTSVDDAGRGRSNANGLLDALSAERLTTVPAGATSAAVITLRSLVVLVVAVSFDGPFSAVGWAVSLGMPPTGPAASGPSTGGGTTGGSTTGAAGTAVEEIDGSVCTSSSNAFGNINRCSNKIAYSPTEMPISTITATITNSAKSKIIVGKNTNAKDRKFTVNDTTNRTNNDCVTKSF